MRPLAHARVAETEMRPASMRRFAPRIVRRASGAAVRAGRWGPTRHTRTARTSAGIATSQPASSPTVAMIAPIMNGPTGSPKLPALMYTLIHRPRDRRGTDPATSAELTG